MKKGVFLTKKTLYKNHKLVRTPEEPLKNLSYVFTWKPFQIVFTPRKFWMNFCQNFAHSFRHFFSNFVLNVDLTFRVNVGNDPQKFVIRWESWFWPNFVQSWFCYGTIHILRNDILIWGQMSENGVFAYLEAFLLCFGNILRLQKANCSKIQTQNNLRSEDVKCCQNTSIKKHLYYPNLLLENCLWACLQDLIQYFSMKSHILIFPAYF